MSLAAQTERQQSQIETTFQNENIIVQDFVRSDLKIEETFAN